jgi:hypothetical protein
MMLHGRVWHHKRHAVHRTDDHLSSGTSMNYVLSGTVYSLVSQQSGQTIWYCYSSAAGGSVKTETGGSFPTAYQATC